MSQYINSIHYRDKVLHVTVKCTATTACDDAVNFVMYYNTKTADGKLVTSKGEQIPGYYNCLSSFFHQNDTHTISNAIPVKEELCSPMRLVIQSKPSTYSSFVDQVTTDIDPKMYGGYYNFVVSGSALDGGKISVKAEPNLNSALKKVNLSVLNYVTHEGADSEAVKVTVFYNTMTADGNLIRYDYSNLSSYNRSTSFCLGTGHLFSNALYIPEGEYFSGNMYVVVEARSSVTASYKTALYATIDPNLYDGNVSFIIAGGTRDGDSIHIVTDSQGKYVPTNTQKKLVSLAINPEELTINVQPKKEDNKTYTIEATVKSTVDSEYIGNWYYTGGVELLKQWVQNDGIVKYYCTFRPIKGGPANITFKVGEISASCKLNLIEEVQPKVESVVLNPTDWTIKEWPELTGEPCSLVATLRTSGDSANKVEFNGDWSWDTNYIHMTRIWKDAKDHLKFHCSFRPIMIGETTITFKSEGKTASCKLHISSNLQTMSFTVTSKSVTEVGPWDPNALFSKKYNTKFIRYEKTDKTDEYRLFFSGPVDYIPPCAFLGKVNLKSVDLPDDCIEVGPGAFGWCTNLTRVKFNSKLEKIGDCAFHSHFWSEDGLGNVSLPKSLKYIGVRAFNSIRDSSIHIKEGVELAQDAFYDTTLKDVYIEGNAPNSKATRIFGFSKRNIHVWQEAVSNFMNHPAFKDHNIKGDLIRDKVSLK